MNPATRLLLALLPIAVAAGCGAVRPQVLPDPVPDTRPETPAAAAERRSQAARPTYNLTGYPPAVRDGYIDGCETAKGSTYGRKDAKRFAGDAQYSMGWNDGFAICKKR